MIAIKYICILLTAILVAGFVITYGKELVQNPAPSWDHMFDKYILSLWILITSFGHLFSILIVIGILFAFYKGIVTMYADGTSSIKKIEEALNPRLPELKIIYESEVSKKTPPPVIEPIQLHPIVHEITPHLSAEEIKEIVRETVTPLSTEDIKDIVRNELQRDTTSIELSSRPRRARSRY